jgi:signal transduction histidine kinase
VKIKFSFLSQRPFYSDASFLRTIFQNTIENAIKYAKPPGYDCFVNIEVKDTPKGIIFKVEDNGIGIPKVLQPKIFDMFFRGTQFAKGSGLGLFIVNSAVKRLGGQIIVESEENIGTTFWVKLPTGLPN